MADYTFDVQKLYLEMLLADAESFARAQNIFDPNSFDRKLQPIAKKKLHSERGQQKILEPILFSRTAFFEGLA